MITRKLGHSEIEVSAVGLGCWAIGGLFYDEMGLPIGWGQIDDQESIRAIHAALDRGVNFFDTADVYGTGHSEEVLGQAFVGRRDEVVIATKFGKTFDSDRRRMISYEATPAYIREAVEASLRRLQTDYIDLYQFHVGRYPTEPGAVVRDTLEALVDEGKIRGYGWCTGALDRARVFAEGANCIAIQHKLNVLHDNDPLLSFCVKQQLASINNGPLAQGLLTGKYSQDTTFAKNDMRRYAENWSADFQNGRPNPEILDKLDAVREILTSNGRTLAQGALAWILARNPNTVPIPGFKNIKQVEDNAAAMEIGPLTTEQMNEIDKLLGRKLVLSD